jgi:AbrB family looped-hinge helix DNA binding protein
MHPSPAKNVGAAAKTSSAKISSKGQITLPAAMRRQLGSDRVRITQEGQRLIIEPDQGLYGALSRYAKPGVVPDFEQERDAAWDAAIQEDRREEHG